MFIRLLTRHSGEQRRRPGPPDEKRAAMAQGTDNLDRVDRQKPYKSEFANEAAGMAVRISRDAVRVNRRSDRRAENARRRSLTDEHRASLAE